MQFKVSQTNYPPDLNYKLMNKTRVLLRVTDMTSLMQMSGWLMTKTRNRHTAEAEGGRGERHEVIQVV